MKLSSWIEKLVRPEVQAMQAYGVADPGDLIKLDAMENPYPWPQSIKRDWLDRLAQIDINRYPDATSRALRQTLKKNMAVPDACEVLLGNGSDELIQMILMAVAKPGATVLAPMPTFVMYKFTAEMVGLNFVSVPLDRKTFDLDPTAMLAACREHKPAIIFIAYPNNPTANLFSREFIFDLIEQSGALVVVDEAYHAFSHKTFMGELNDYDNLLVMRTVSKLGLAGLRLGLLAGKPEWLREFDKIRLPYNINSLTQASAQFALENSSFLQEQTRDICEQRDSLFRSMSDLEEIEVWPSAANFLLFRPRDESADKVFQGLKQGGVLIKNMDKADPMLRGCLRVTVGTEEENRIFLSTLKTVLKVN